MAADRENVISGAGMAGTMPQGGVSEGAGPKIYNCCRVPGRSSRDLAGYRTEALVRIHRSRESLRPQPERNVIVGGRHGRNNAADGVSEGAGPGIYNYRRIFARSSRGTEQKPEDAAITGGIGGSRGRLCPQPEKM